MPVSSDLPLTSLTIVVTRAAEQSSQFSQLLLAQGASVLEFPALVIGPPTSWQPLDEALTELSSFDWLILTSANGVDFFFERLQVLKKNSQALQGLKIAVVGKKTAASLEKFGIYPDFIPPNFVADDLVTHFPQAVAAQRFLFPRVETGGREVLVQALREKGGVVVEVPAYRSTCPQTMPINVWQGIQAQQVQVITFASAKTVENVYCLLQSALGQDDSEHLTQLLKNICLASIGPQTSLRCQECFGRVDLEAQEFTLEGLTQALIDWAGNSRLPG